jgi:hypothetical protein
MQNFRTLRLVKKLGKRKRRWNYIKTGTNVCRRLQRRMSLSKIVFFLFVNMCVVK